MNTDKRPEKSHTNPSQGSAAWQRFMLAIFASLLIVGGCVIAWFPILDTNSREYFSGTLLKVGFVCGLAWLAAPQLERFGWHRLRGTLLVAVVLVLVLWSIRPKIGAMAGALLIGGSAVFMLFTWLRGVVTTTRDTGDFSGKTGKIEKNPTRS